MKHMAKVLPLCALGFLLKFLDRYIYIFVFWLVFVELTFILKAKPIVLMNISFGEEDEDANMLGLFDALDFFLALVPGTYSF